MDKNGGDGVDELWDDQKETTDVNNANTGTTAAQRRTGLIVQS